MVLYSKSGMKAMTSLHQDRPNLKIGYADSYGTPLRRFMCDWQSSVGKLWICILYTFGLLFGKGVSSWDLETLRQFLGAMTMTM